MSIVHVQKSDFNKILDTAESLIDEVEQVLSQDDIVRKRLDDIRKRNTKGRTEAELNKYLKGRGVKVD